MVQPSAELEASAESCARSEASSSIVTLGSPSASIEARVHRLQDQVQYQQARVVDRFFFFFQKESEQEEATLSRLDESEASI